MPAFTMTPNSPPSPSKQDISCLSLAICASVLVMSAILTLSFGPGGRLASELVPSFYNCQENLSLVPLLSFDASFTEQIKMPYCGWPPLYGVLLAPLAWIGLPFGLSVVLLNSFLAMISGLLAFKVFKSAGLAEMAGQASMATTISTGICGNLSMAFPHAMIPPLMLATILAFNLNTLHEKPRSPIQLIALGSLVGIICGFSNWACFFAVGSAAVLVTAILLSSATAKRHSLRACLLMAIPMVVFLCISFWVLLIFKNHAFTDPAALPFRPAIDGDKLLSRITGSANSYARAFLYSAFRIFIVITPIAAALAVSRVSGWIRFMIPGCEASLLIAMLAFPAAAYAIIFVGESYHTDHGFYSILWVAPSLGLLTLIRPLRARAASLALALFLGAANLFILTAWKWLPPSCIQAKGIPISYLTINGPGISTAACSSEGVTARSLLRAFIKQTLPLPYVFFEQSSKLRSIRALADEIALETSGHDVILIFADTNIQWNMARFSHKTVVGANADNVEGIFRFFEGLEKPLNVLVLVPTGQGTVTQELVERHLRMTEFRIREIKIEATL